MSASVKKPTDRSKVAADSGWEAASTSTTDVSGGTSTTYSGSANSSATTDLGSSSYVSSVMQAACERSALRSPPPGPDRQPETSLPPIGVAPESSAKQDPSRSKPSSSSSSATATHLPSLKDQSQEWSQSPQYSARGAPRTEEPASGPSARFCTQCGQGLVPNGRFCAACGAAVVQVPVLRMDAALRNSVPEASKSSRSTVGQHVVGNSSSSKAAPSGSASAREPRNAKAARASQGSGGASSSASPPPKGGRGAVSKGELAYTAPVRMEPWVDGAMPSAESISRAEQSYKSVANAASSYEPVPPQQKAASMPSKSKAAKQAQVENEAMDPTLQSVGNRMTDALLAYYSKRGVHEGIVRNWAKFFQDLDTDGSGKLTFEELDAAVRHTLRAKISRYELRVFWRRLDQDKSGLVTLREFVRLFYRIELSEWGDLPQAGLQRVVRVLNSAAEKWHRSGGNWFKIFTAVDCDSSGSLAFDELKRVVRGNNPALQIPESEISEADLQGLWKACDLDRSMEITVQEFMVSMRRHGASHSMHKVTTYSKKKRGTYIEPDKTPIAAPDRTPEQLSAMAKTLESALQSYWKGNSRGVLPNYSSGTYWERFFQEVDSDRSGRLNFREFSEAVASKLGKYATAISADDLRALWVYSDPNNSGEVTATELNLSIYRLELQSWPVATDELVQRVVAEMNAAAQHKHRAAGNWYKMFLLVDADSSGRIGYDEFASSLVRSALAISQKRMSVEDLRALWKRLDGNLSSDITVQEFMSFMRKWGAKHSMHKKVGRQTQYSTKSRGLSEGQARDLSAEIAAAPQLSVAQLADISSRLARLLTEWLIARGIGSGVTARSDVTSPALWTHLFAFTDTDKSGRLGFGEFESACKRHLKSAKTVNDGELRALWRAIDADGSLEVTSKEFGSGIYRIQLQLWPVADEASICQYIHILNRAAEYWHQSGGNWYKVFKRCDVDGSGNMEYDEMMGVFRRHNPGLSISPKELTDEQCRGFWKAIDSSLNGSISVKEFMSFMRLHGKALDRMNTSPKNKKEKPPALPPVERTTEQLRTAVRLLEAALNGFWKSRGVHTDLADPPWPKFFKDADKDGSGRLTFEESWKIMSERLPKGNASNRSALHADELIQGVTRDDLIALWQAADANGSGEVTTKEWALCLYRIEIEDWPEPGPLTLGRAVDTINEAAQRWHRAGGNWYKVFKTVDTDDSGQMGYDELKAMCYRPLPCLAIPAKRLKEIDLKAVWKALDKDRSGMTSVNEFMCFMRKHGTFQFHNSPREKRPRFVGLGSRAGMQAEDETDATAGVGSLSADQLNLLSNALSKHTADTVAAAYTKWKIPWSGEVSEWDLLSIFRKLLGISEEQINDDEIYTVWIFLDRSNAGQVPVSHLLSLGSKIFGTAPAEAEDADGADSV